MSRIWAFSMCLCLVAMALGHPTRGTHKVHHSGVESGKLLPHFASHKSMSSSHPIHKLEERVIVSEPDENIKLTQVQDYMCDEKHNPLRVKQIKINCRPTTAFPANLLGGQHCGLILIFEVQTQELVKTWIDYPNALFLDLGVGELFYHRMSSGSIPSDFVKAYNNGKPATRPDKTAFPKEDANFRVTDISAAWKAIEDIPTQAEELVAESELSGKGPISPCQIAKFLLSYNHHFPFYDVRKCNCVLFNYIFLKHFVSLEAAEDSRTRALSRLTTVGKIARPMGETMGYCYRHFYDARAEEAEWANSFRDGTNYLSGTGRTKMNHRYLNWQGYDKHGDMVFAREKRTSAPRGGGRETALGAPSATVFSGGFLARARRAKVVPLESARDIST